MKIKLLLMLSIISCCATNSECTFFGFEENEWNRIDQPDIKLGEISSSTPGYEKHAEWYQNERGEYGICVPCNDEYEYGGTFESLKEHNGIYETDKSSLHTCGPY